MNAIVTNIATIISAVAALLAAYHSSRSSKKSTEIRANVNGNLSNLVGLLAQAGITIPHEVATKVISAPPADPTATTTEFDPVNVQEQIAEEWFRKIGHDNPVPRS